MSRLFPNFFFLLLIGCLAGSAEVLAMGAKRAEVAGSIIQAYGGQCKSYGTWTEAALAQTRSLESIVNELKSKNECKGINSALANAQNLSQQIQQLAGDPVQTALKEAQDVKRHLLIELKAANDPNLQAALAASLAQAEVTLAQAKATAMSSNAGNTRLVSGLSQATSYLNAILTDPGLGQCALHYPELGVQIGAQALAIGGAFVNPAVGVAASAAGSLISNLITFLRMFRLDRALWKLQATELSIALSCGLESMETTFCAAQDQYFLAKIEADSYQGQWQPNEFWRGLDLWSHRIPGLLRWVSRVATGISPTDPSGAERQNRVRDRLALFSSIERSTQGYMGDVTIKEFFPTRTHLLYRLVGLQLDCNPGGIFGGGNCKDEQTIPLPQNGFQGIATNAQKVFDEIRSVLNQDLHKVIDLDSQGLLVEATQRGQIGKESPIEVLRDTYKYLSDAAVYFSRTGNAEIRQTLTLIEDTKLLLAEIIKGIETSSGNTADNDAVVSQLFNNLKLISGTDFLSSRLYRIINWELNSRLENGDFPKNIGDIIKGSGRDAAEELSFSTQVSLDTLLEDINNAQAVTQQNIQNFSEFFGQGFSYILKSLKVAANRDREPTSGPQRPNHRILSRTCILLAAGLTKWPKSINPELCQGAVLDSIYPGFTEKVTFEGIKKGLDSGQPLNERICSYRNFMRRSVLFGSTQPRAPRARTALSF
ncbi:MAG: hypothetical protein HYX41_06945 [Bdellovibrio sp.]|nr:hypothetical protein [Bdellovibrio sp.]